MRRADERVDVFFETLVDSPKLYIDELERKALENEVPIIRRPTRNLLRYLLRVKKPKRVLEIGTAVGYSALFMKECLEEGSRITTIEKVPARILEAQKNFDLYDEHKQICLLEGEAEDLLQKLTVEGFCYDFVFMDAAKGQYMNFLMHVLAMLNPEGVLVSDNILHEGDVLESRYAVTRRDRTIHSRMRKYLKFLMNEPCLETVCLPIGDGVALSTKKGE